MSNAARLKDDLQWVVRSEPLFKSATVAGATPDSDGVWPTAAWFKELPLPLVDLSDYDNFNRLGLWFEHIIQRWAETSPETEVLAHNLQVQGDTRTIGEFDLLLNFRGRLEHWELAVKFYLATGRQQNLACWHGPNPEDTLGTKLGRLSSHQLALSDQPDAEKLLQAKGWKIERRRAWVKGRLFYPYDQFRRGEFSFANEINPGHEKGWWMSREAFACNQEIAASRLCLLPKSLWLAELSAHHEASLTTLDEIVSGKALESGDTHHIAILNDEGKELSRGFVVSPRWISRVNPGYE